MSEFVQILAAVVVVAAVATLFVVVRFGRGRGRSATQEDAVWAERTRALSEAQSEIMVRIKALAEAQTTTQAQLTKALNERLDTVSKGMGDKLEASALKTAQSLGDLKKHLNVIDEAQKNIVELSGQVVGLQDILAHKQARGAFGEVQLADLVQNILPPDAFEMQATLSNKKRADCLILLPNPPGSIAVDAKFPLESFHSLRNAPGDNEKTLAARQFRIDLKKHIDDIAEKYILPGETAESALMFLPSEAVYAELYANFTDVTEYSYRKRVWIVSPTTLMATLNTVRAILKDVRMREQAHIIQQEIHKLLDDVTRLDKRVGNLQSHFDQATNDIRQIRTSSEKIVKRGERIEDLQIEEAGEVGEIAAAVAPAPEASATLPFDSAGGSKSG